MKQNYTANKKAPHLRGLVKELSMIICSIFSS